MVLYRLFFLVLCIYLGAANLMASPKKIMIFWYGMGMGHRVPAERISAYIQEQFAQKNEKVEIDLVDIKRFSLFDPNTEETGKRKYLDWASKNSESYTKYFKWYLETHPRDIKSNFDLYRLSHYLLNKKPDLVITTFWGAGHALYQIKKVFGEDFQIPHAMLYTDYKVRRFAYMVPEIDKIFLGSKALKDDVTIKYPELSGLEDHFDYSGIPVNYEKIKELMQTDKNTLKVKLGFNPAKKLITLARGGEVQLPLTEMIRKIIKEDRSSKAQVLVLAGRNETDHEELVDLIEEFGAHRLKKLGFIANHKYLEYISASDLLITKPGGVGITEASLLKVPLLLMKGLGGQEIDNTEEFVKHGLAYYEPELEGVREKVAQFLATPMGKLFPGENFDEYFANYEPERIAIWASQEVIESNWSGFALRVKQSETIPLLQKKDGPQPFSS